MRSAPFVAGLAALLAVSMLPAPATSAARPDAIGVVVLHGKSGGRSDDNTLPVANRLEREGYPVERPEMCWSWRRIYDRTFPDCLAEIDAAVTRLKSRGARHIVIAGMSLGGAAAFSYGASRDGLAGIVALAPGHNPAFYARNPRMARAVEEARRLVAEGKANEPRTFADDNQGDTDVRTTPAIYLSFFDPKRPELRMAQNVSHLRAPVLWVSGSRDERQRYVEGQFAQAPANPLNRFVTVNSDHLRTPAAAESDVAHWMKDLAATLP
jgi:dienelactone hydrolase